MKIIGVGNLKGGSWKDDDINITGISVREIWQESTDGRCRCAR